MSTTSLQSGRDLSPGFRIAHWLSNGGRDWIYVGKVVLAALLALGIAMRLDLPQPRTAMTTVFIVMQPQNGMVLAKGLYRFLGTIIGLAMMLLLISLFSQEPVLYLTAAAVWMAICTTGAAHYRDFRSYGFALSGYTAVLVGIPAAQHAPDAFLISMTRLAELSLGIFCATAVSALVFPQFSGDKVVESMHRRFSDFVAYTENVFASNVDGRDVEQANARFVAEIVGFETSRAVAVLENPDMRIRSGRFARLNAEFMGMTTRLHALHKMMDRLRSAGALRVVAAVEPLLHEATSLLDKTKECLLTPERAGYASSQIEVFRNGLTVQIAVARMTLRPSSNDALLEFDTATELLSRFIDDFDAYAKTYLSLATPLHERERWFGRYVPKTNMIVATVAGLRTALLMLLLSAFWIRTGWQSGGMAVLNGGAICALSSSSLRPRKLAFDMAVGTTIAALFGFVATYGIYPKLDGFLELCLALTPFLAFGAWLTTRRKLMGYGVGYCIYFCFLAGPDNVVIYNPSSYINDSLAVVVSMFSVWAVFSLVLPTTGRWLPHLLLRELAQQIAFACKGKLQHVGTRFESRTRDLFWQISGSTNQGSDLQREASESLFMALEIGHTVVDLRSEMANFPLMLAAVEGGQTLVGRVSVFIDAIALLFSRPSRSKLTYVLAMNTLAMNDIKAMLRSPGATHQNRCALQRALTQMHFIRMAMLDVRPLLQTKISG